MVPCLWQMPGAILLHDLSLDWLREPGKQALLISIDRTLTSQECIKTCAVACRRHPLCLSAISCCLQATGRSQRVVATFDLQGPGLYPLSEQGKQALLSTVNQTLAAQGSPVANITLGQVNVRPFVWAEPPQACAMRQHCVPP